MKFIKGAKGLPTDKYVIARFWGEVGHAIRYREKIAFRHTQGTTCWKIDHEDLQHLEWLDESEDDLQVRYDELKAKYDAILATADGHSSQTENVWQSGYAAGHDAGYEKGKKMVRPKSVYIPEFQEIIDSMSEEDKRKVDDRLEAIANEHNKLLQIAMLSPALKWRSIQKGKAAYPERFEGKVPLKVKVRRNVYPDLPFGNKEGTECIEGQEYYVWVNNLGAVAAILPNGEQLGLKPNEFDVTEYHA